MGNNSYLKEKSFIRERKSGFLLTWSPEYDISGLLEKLFPNPDDLFFESHIVKPGTRTHAGIVSIGTQKFFLKRYNCRGFKYQILNAFRSSRASRAWNIAWALRAYHFPIPFQYALLEKRRFRLLGESYILMQYIEGTETLSKLWVAMSENEKIVLLKKLGNLIGRMHRLGFVHGDLKWTNLLIHPKDNFDITIIDLDSCYFSKINKKSLILKDVRRFVNDLSRKNQKENLKNIFILSWEESSGIRFY